MGGSDPGQSSGGKSGSSKSLHIQFNARTAASVLFKPKWDDLLESDEVKKKVSEATKKHPMNKINAARTLLWDGLTDEERAECKAHAKHLNTEPLDPETQRRSAIFCRSRLSY